MNKNILPSTLMAVSLLTGCAMAPAGPGTGEPAFCVSSILGQGGPMTSGIFSNYPFLFKLPRNLRVLPAGSSSAEGCDVMLTISEGIAETTPEAVRLSQQYGRQSDCSITAFSAYTKKQLWKVVYFSPDCVSLLPLLRRDFQPGKPAYNLIGKPAPSGEQL
ncbi:MAG: hypothetical protein ABII00_06115 [Elusimicrobiota bacterium]